MSSISDTLLGVGCLIIMLSCSSCVCVESTSYLRTVVDGSALDSITESQWNYGCIDGLNGPSQWGKLSPKWALCGEGKSQSPILIQTGALETSNELVPLNLFPSEASLQTDIDTATIQKNSLKLNIGGWSLLLESIRYDLVQIHFHTPAEHRINGGIYALEMQHKFISEFGDIAIISVFYKYGKNNSPYISQYFKYLPLLENENTVTNVTVPVHLAQEDLYPYYLYKGSLTQPPCIEGVTWIIAQNVKLLSQAQVEALKGTTKGNSNRPLQPVNGRKVFVPAY